MKKLIALAFTALLVVACSKDQQASKKLDGSWRLTEVNDVAVQEDENVSITFEKGKDGEGTGTQSYTEGSATLTVDFTYKVRGDQLIMESGGDVDSSIIISLEKDFFKINDGDNSYRYDAK